MDRTTHLRDLLERVFDSHRDDLREELPADEYERRRHDFAFHLTDWAGDLTWFADLAQHPDRADAGAVEQKLIGFLYHVIPHLSAAGRLLLDQVPDPFADPHPLPEARAGDHLPVG